MEACVIWGEHEGGAEWGRRREACQVREDRRAALIERAERNASCQGGAKWGKGVKIKTPGNEDDRRSLPASCMEAKWKAKGGETDWNASD